MKASAETTLAIAADPKRLGAKIGMASVLHTWSSPLTHHPHVHMTVPGGAAASGWMAHAATSSATMLAEAQPNNRLRFSNAVASLADAGTFKRFLGPLRHPKWVVLAWINALGRSVSDQSDRRPRGACRK